MTARRGVAVGGLARGTRQQGVAAAHSCFQSHLRVPGTPPPRTSFVSQASVSSLSPVSAGGKAGLARHSSGICAVDPAPQTL